MNAFLLETKHAYQNILLNPTFYNRLRIVLGNESCDLDSAISSLVYGFVLHHQGIEDNFYKTAVLPLLNIPHDDLVLKTEVTHFLKTSGIFLDHVPTRGFRDLLDLKKVHECGVLELTLVDHHNLSSWDEELQSSVVEVIDHRPQDPQWLWKEISNVTIQNVGSCCTLVAQKIKEKSPHLMTKEIARLLLGPILLDTVNLSPGAGRATPLDEEMVTFLESTAPVNREDLYDDLVHAKSNIDDLTTSQVLRKDLKIVGGVPIAGVPIQIRELTKRSDFEHAVVNFRRLRNDAPVMVLLGVHIDHDTVSRDLAVSGKNLEVVNIMLEPLLSSIEPSLELEEVLDHGISNMRLFRQGNVKATRKHIAPIISCTASGLEEVFQCGLG